VNFWAEAFESEEPELRKLRPFTSADLDLYRPDSSAGRLLHSHAKGRDSERDPFGKAFTIVSHTFLIGDEAGHVLTVDALKTIPGLSPAEVKKGTMIVEFAGVTLRMLNPIACLKAKLHNVRKLDQKDRQDEKHVRILIHCVRAFIRRLLAEGIADGNLRPAFNAIKYLFYVTSASQAIKIARTRGFNLLETIPGHDIASAGHPKLFKFTQTELPKWKQRLRNI
jgi:hypothetical protein